MVSFCSFPGSFSLGEKGPDTFLPSSLPNLKPPFRGGYRLRVQPGKAASRCPCLAAPDALLSGCTFAGFWPCFRTRSCTRLRASCCFACGSPDQRRGARSPCQQHRLRFSSRGAGSSQPAGEAEAGLLAGLPWGREISGCFVLGRMQSNQNRTKTNGHFRQFITSQRPHFKSLFLCTIKAHYNRFQILL